MIGRLKSCRTYLFFTAIFLSAFCLETPPKVCCHAGLKSLNLWPYHHGGKPASLKQAKGNHSLHTHYPHTMPHHTSHSHHKHTQSLQTQHMISVAWNMHKHEPRGYISHLYLTNKSDKIWSDRQAEKIRDEKDNFSKITCCQIVGHESSGQA